MARTVPVIAFIIGMVLALGLPVLPVAAKSGFVWGTAELIETDDASDLGASAVQVAVDPQGNAVAVWHQYDGIRFNIWANRFVPGVGWGTAELIETIDAGFNENAVFPQVAVDPQGRATVVWAQFDGTSNDIWANRFVPGVGWGTAERIETDDATVGRVQVAVDPQGNAVAVWRQLPGIWANRFVPGVGWGTAELVAAGGFFAQVAVDSQGNAVAVWTDGDGIRWNISANRFVPGVGWGTPELIGPVASSDSSPQVAADSQGRATAVWHLFDGTRGNISANRFVPGLGWGTAELIETDDAGNARNPQVAVDPQGNVTAVWSQHDGTRFNIWANRFVPGVGWGTAELIETNAGGAGGPQVAVDPQGNVTAVWSQHDGTRWNNWANRFVPGLGWGTPELIETNNAGGATLAQVAVDPQGRAVAVWQQHDGTRNNIWANRFAEPADIVPPTAVAGEDQTVNAGDTVSFDASASSDDVAIVSYEWDFGDETTGTGETTTHTYTDPGTYTVTLTVRDAAGNLDTDVLTVTVEAGPEPPPPGLSPEVTLFVAIGVAAAAAAGIALLLWRRRAGGKGKA